MVAPVIRVHITRVVSAPTACCFVCVGFSNQRRSGQRSAALTTLALTNATATNHAAAGVMSQFRFSQAIAIPATAAALMDGYDDYGS